MSDTVDKIKANPKMSIGVGIAIAIVVALIIFMIIYFVQAGKAKAACDAGTLTNDCVKNKDAYNAQGWIEKRAIGKTLCGSKMSDADKAKLAAGGKGLYVDTVYNACA